MRITYLILFVCLFYGCGPVVRYYKPVMFNMGFRYLPKPISEDSIHTSQYIALGYGAVSANNFSEDASFGQFNLVRSHYFKNFNLAYGSSGYFGTYHANPGR